MVVKIFVKYYYLLGVKPIWDGPSRRVIDLEIIPLSILNRARVDVTLDFWDV